MDRDAPGLQRVATEMLGSLKTSEGRNSDRGDDYRLRRLYRL